MISQRVTVLEGAQGFPSGQRGRVVPALLLTCRAFGTGHCTFPQERRAEEVGDRGRELPGRTGSPVQGERCLSRPPAPFQTSTSAGGTRGACAATSVRTRLAPTTAAAPWASGSPPTAAPVKVRAGRGQGSGPLGLHPLPSPTAHFPATPPVGLLGNDSLVPQHASDDVSAGAMPLKMCLSEMTALPVSPGSSGCR